MQCITWKFRRVGDNRSFGKDRYAVVFTPEVLLEGGGRTANITVMVTDKAGNPVEGAKVVFDATAFEVDKIGERNAQLSQTEMTTDASDKAVVTYTTLAKDDKWMVQLYVSAFNKDPDLEEFRDYKIMAAN